MPSKSETINCKADEGSDINLSGTANSLSVSANEGSDIDAFDMIVKDCKVNVSEGSDAKLHVTESLDARAHEDSDIEIKGNPSNKNIQADEGCDVVSR